MTASTLLAVLQDPEVRLSPGAAALVDADPSLTESALAFLRVGLQAKEQGLRSHSLRALEQLGSAAKSAVPELTELLTEESAWQMAAARVLGQIGPAAKAAVPVLKTVLKSEEEELRQAAHEALKKIDPSGLEMTAACVLRALDRGRSSRG